MPTLRWGSREGSHWAGRAEAGAVPGATLRPRCPGNGMSLRSSAAPALRGHVVDQGRLWAGSEVASPADVRVGRRGPCPRGGDQGFAGSLETELMYLQMMMEILILFVLFCF